MGVLRHRFCSRVFVPFVLPDFIHNCRARKCHIVSRYCNVKYDSASPVLLCSSLEKGWCNVGPPACRQPSTSSSQQPTCHLPMASRLGNRCLRPTATNTARSTDCPAQPPPPWRQRPTSTFSLALSVHGLWARVSIACGPFHGAFLACGSPAPKPPAPPPHDLLRTVSAARPRLCSASGSVGDHDLHALSLTRSLWKQAH